MDVRGYIEANASEYFGALKDQDPAAGLWDELAAAGPQLAGR
jgi:hypothetical protein